MNRTSSEILYPDFVIGQLWHFYIYFALAFGLCFYWVYKSEAKHKVELFLLCFYLLTGSINEILTISIPGFSFFEIQPRRFLLFIFGFFLFRRWLFGQNKDGEEKSNNIPIFHLFLILYIFYIGVAQLSHFPEVELKDIVLELIFAFTFLVFILATQWFTDGPSLKVLATVIITSAVFSTLIGFIQIGVDPEFMRVGDSRIAFGDVMRSNGIFEAEYFNSYFLITAMAWTLVAVKRFHIKLFLIFLLVAGVICSFQRMSWLVMIFVLISYFFLISRVALSRLILSCLLFMALGLSLGLYFYDDINQSSFVKQRLSEPIDSRYGYYAMVIDNIGKKPIFGFGGRKNEVYYYNMLKITNKRGRATGEDGSIHNGYLESMFYFGIPAMVLFILFLFSVFIYFLAALRSNLFFSIPLLVTIIYSIASLTNTFAFSSYLSSLLAIHIGIGLAYKRIIREGKFEFF